MDTPIQITTLMHLSHNANIDKLIQEVSQFSCLRMFGHLFDLRHGLETQLRSIERICSSILEVQFGQALKPGSTSSSQANLTLTSSKLEQALAVCFNPHSPFWEQFYARLHGSGSGDSNVDVLHLTEKDLQSVARSHFPCFYTMIDALHFGASQSDHVYTLVQLSLQSYLKGLLQSISDPAGASLAFEQAIRILGPVNAPLYRELIIQKLTP